MRTSTVPAGTPAGPGDKITTCVNSSTNTFAVAGDVSVRYGAGFAVTQFDNLDVGGDVTVRHGVGNSIFVLINDAGEGTFSHIAGNVSVTNTDNAIDLVAIARNYSRHVSIQSTQP